MSTVLGDLAQIGYDAEWHCIPGFYVGSPQGRDRVWIIAYPSGTRNFKYVVNGGIFANHKRPEIRGEDWVSTVVVNGEVAPSKWESKRQGISPRPMLIRSVNGVPSELDRLTQLGNSVIPQIIEILGRAIMQIERRKHGNNKKG